MKKFLSLFFFLALALVFVGCKEDKEYTLSLAGPETVKVGDSITLVPTTDKPEAVFTWTSSNTAVATVNNGVVTGVAKGTAVVTVKVEGVGEKFLVVNVSEFSFSLAGGDSVKVEKTLTLTATTDKPSPSYTWSTSDASVATVANGVVTGKKAGTATITCALAGVGSLTKVVTVRALTTLTVGSTTEAGVNMFSTFWGNNATNADVRALTFGYGTVSYQKEAARYEIDPTVVKKLDVKANEDGTKTYTIEINQGLVWNDGTPIDAKDYVFPMLMGINPVFATAIGKALTTTGDIVGSKDFADPAKNADGKAELPGVDLLGDYKFSITINADRFPYYYEFLYYSAAPWPLHVIAPKADIVQGTNGAKITGTWTVDALKETVDKDGKGYRYDISVTCGPYNLYNFDEATSTATLKINEKYAGDYQGQKPDIDYVVFKYVTSATQMQALLNGEIDLIESVSGGDAIIAGLKEVAYDKIKFSTFSRNGYGLIAFHCDKPAGPTADVEVRQAIAYLINRNLFLETYTRGYGILPNGQYGLAQWMVEASMNEDGVVQGRDKDGKEVALNSYSYDPVKAVQLLEQAGWKYDAEGKDYVQAPDYTSVRYKKEGDKLVKLSVPWGNTPNNPVSELIRSQLLPNAKAVGMEITDQTMDFNTLLYKHYYGAYGDGYGVPKDEDGDGKWTEADIPEYEKEETDAREYHMVNLGTGFSTGLFEPYYDVSIEYWGWDGGANINYLYDKEMLEAAEKMMRAASDEEYLRAWQQYQLRYNILLPSLPLYSDMYHAFYSPKLKNYEVTAEWTMTEAILYATVEG
ncbi:MAG TPA: ABC transporter substrate-binding protein [Bacilli bacterium]|nr:ABC transporter substrate-binding protein [Bacilli bacterium]HQC73967.1 ABC transporter substrate-binding protein [Bacilli bacterium]